MTKFNQAFLERFWAKVEKGQECWIWKGAKRGKGYGVIMLDGKPKGAHRVSYAIHNKDLDISERCDVSRAFREQVYVLHSCDNPSCVNPAHLRLGTTLENLDEKVAKGRHTFGAAHPASKLSDHKVIEIRRLDGSKVSLEKMARKLGVCVSTVREAYLGRTWKHVDQPKI